MTADKNIIEMVQGCTIDFTELPKQPFPISTLPRNKAAQVIIDQIARAGEAPKELLRWQSTKRMFLYLCKTEEG